MVRDKTTDSDSAFWQLELLLLRFDKDFRSNPDVKAGLMPRVGYLF
jgi:hypothetical protein